MPGAEPLPALLPAPAPSSTPTTTSAVPAATMGDAAVSPVNSDKTVVARPRRRPREMRAQPGSGVAILSTDGGRRPYRKCPSPAPPVIVRSDKAQGIMAYAQYWRDNCPEFYHCFFFQDGWTIEDVWDEYEIHIETAEFLEEVLQLIMRDNEHCASKFAQSWCWAHRNTGMLRKLHGDLHHLVNSSDRLAFVDAFFTQQELESADLKDSPREYLFHALWLAKTTMNRTFSNYHAGYPQYHAVPGVPTGPQVNNDAFPAIVDEMSTPSNLHKQQALAIRTRPAFETQSSTGPGLVPPTANGPQIRQPTSAPFPASRPVINQGDVVETCHPAVTMPGRVGGQPRNVKRPGRSESNHFTQTPQLHGYVENVRMPSGEQMRHSSGPVPNGGPPRYAPNMSMAPAMMNPQPNGQLPPNMAISSPPMHNVQMQYPPMMVPAVYAPPGAVPPRSQDPAYQQYGSNVPGPRVPPFSDMANNTQYPPIRGVDAREIPRRNGHRQNMKTQGLYNPYGAERPDKAADFTAGTSRRGGRGNFMNIMGRGRQQPAGSFGRSGYGSFPSNCSDHITNTIAGPSTKGPQARDGNHGHETDPNITRDKEFGCDHTFIGPKNTLVRQLFVRNLPASMRGADIDHMFLECAGVFPRSSEIRFTGDRREYINAFVFFHTTDDARKALEAKITVQGEKIQVSVSRRHFQIGASSCATKQESRRSQNSSSVPGKPNLYSPQDVRSVMPQGKEQQQPKTLAMCGSPEVKKKKKSAEKLLGERIDRKTKASEEKSNSVKLVPKHSTKSSAGNSELSSKDEKNRTQEHVVVAETNEATIDASLNSVKESSPTKTPAIKTSTKEKRGVAFDLAGAPSNSGPAFPKTIIESIPTETQAPLPVLPTKVSLPPSIKHVHETVPNKSIPGTVTTDKQVDVVIAVPRVQEEAISDDDQKHDVSFHSAQESQPDLGSEEDRKKQGGNNAHTDQKASDPSVLKDNQSTVLQSEAATRQDDPKCSTGDDLGANDQQGDSVTPASEKVLGETGKKQGAKQTESLNPYSRAAKAQLKKAKKKEKSKDKERKKGKPDETSQGEDTQDEEKGSRVQDVGITGLNEVLEEEKHKRRKVKQYVEVQSAEQVISDSTAQSHREKSEAAPTATAVAPLAKLAAPKHEMDQVQRMAKKPKAATAKIAVPSLELLKRKSSPTSATTPPHAAYFSVASHQAGAVEGIVEALEYAEARSTNSVPHDAASIASSSTLRGTSPPRIPTSPTASNFHTPLQTPTAPGVATAEMKKKNKKKIKNQKKASNAKETSNVKEADEPFHDQLSQIKTHTGYYSLRGKELPAQEELGWKEDRVDKEDKVKGPKNMFRKVQAYVAEKTSGYSRLPMNAWEKDNRKEAEKMTPAEGEELMSGSRLPANAAMSRYSQEMDSPQRAPKAGKQPYFGR